MDKNGMIIKSSVILYIHNKMLLNLLCPGLVRDVYMMDKELVWYHILLKKIPLQNEQKTVQYKMNLHPLMAVL